MTQQLVIDSAHGATYHIARHVFHELGADVTAIGNQPDGKNINDGCGATSPASLQNAVDKCRLPGMKTEWGSYYEDTNYSTAGMSAKERQVTALLEFMLKEIGPSVYNGAITEAQAFLRARLGDLEATCYEPEFPHWPKGTSVRRK